MLDQTTMNGRRSKSPAKRMGRSMAGLLHDLITLAELQTQLVAVDLKEGTGRSIVPIVLIVGAVLLTLGTMPVILLGIGWALVNLAGFSEGAAFLLVSRRGVGRCRRVRLVGGEATAIRPVGADPVPTGVVRKHPLDQTGAQERSSRGLSTAGVVDCQPAVFRWDSHF